MIMILSDGSPKVAEIEKKLKLHNQKYIVYFSDIVAAARYGKGNVTVGSPDRYAIRQECGKYKITDVIDVSENPYSELSKEGLFACRGDIRYIKYMELPEISGVKLCMSYKKIADRIEKSGRNTLMYASHKTVREIAGYSGENKTKIYVPVLKTGIFDVNSALQYSVPLCNVTELDGTEGCDAVSEAIERCNAGLIVCDGTYGFEDKVKAAKKTGAEVIRTHGYGIEFPHVALNADDVIYAVSKG